MVCGLVATYVSRQVQPAVVRVASRERAFPTTVAVPRRRIGRRRQPRRGSGGDRVACTARSLGVLALIARRDFHEVPPPESVRDTAAACRQPSVAATSPRRRQAADRAARGIGECLATARIWPGAERLRRCRREGSGRCERAAVGRTRVPGDEAVARDGRSRVTRSWFKSDRAANRRRIPLRAAGDLHEEVLPEGQASSAVRQSLERVGRGGVRAEK